MMEFLLKDYLSIKLALSMNALHFLNEAKRIDLSDIQRQILVLQDHILYSKYF